MLWKSHPLARIAASIGLWGLAWALWAQTLEGHVVCVNDGDTLTLVDATQQEHSLRLAGIDAPEKGQPHGQAARLALAQVVQGRAVRFQVLKQDRYGRWVGRLSVDGEDAGLKLIAAGLAWHYLRYAQEQTEEERRRYAEAERQARQASLGLWSDPNPVPPWEWRTRGPP